VLSHCRVCCGLLVLLFFSSRRRHTRFSRDWSSDVCSSDLVVLREQHALSGTRARALSKLRHQHQDLFAQVLQEGVDAGVFRSADSVTVLGVLGLFNWTYVWFDHAKGPLTPEQVADKLTDLVLYGQLVPPSRKSNGKSESATR